MSSLFAALQTSANALGVFEQAIATVQNNTTNASTPGYVTQSVNLESRPFQPGNNLLGGVSAGPTLDSRSQFAEQGVWAQSELLGASTQKASSLSQIESQFDVSGTSGIPGALSTLTSAFSAWSNNPSDATARTQVLNAATTVAAQFNTTSTNLQNLQTQTDSQLSSTVTQINQTVANIASINSQAGGLGSKDAGVQAQIYSQLEKLSSLTPITVQTAQNGSLTILMNGQVQLLSGTTQTALHVAYPSVATPTIPGASAHAAIETPDGQDVTTKATSGQLGGLLDVRNNTLPGLLGDQTQPGTLNTMAKSFADRVNNILSAGVVAAGPPPIPGKTLFTYDTSMLGAVAGTLTVDATVAPSDLGAIQTSPTTVANGIPNQLAQVNKATNAGDPTDPISGTSISDYYSQMATNVGNQASAANNLQSSQTDLLTQAKNLRSQVSGVDLNAQAAQLLQFQQAYEASSKIITVVNQMTSDLMNLIQ